MIIHVMAHCSSVVTFPVPSTGYVCPSQTSIQIRGTLHGPFPPSSQVCSASWWRKAPPLAASRPLTTRWVNQNQKQRVTVKRNTPWWAYYDVWNIISFSFQKRQLSAQSLAFNLKDKVFCELFPDVVDVSAWALFCSFLSFFSVF